MTEEEATSILFKTAAMMVDADWEKALGGEIDKNAQAFLLANRGSREFQYGGQSQGFLTATEAQRNDHNYLLRNAFQNGGKENYENYLSVNKGATENIKQFLTIQGRALLPTASIGADGTIEAKGGGKAIIDTSKGLLDAALNLNLLSILYKEGKYVVGMADSYSKDPEGTILAFNKSIENTKNVVYGIPGAVGNKARDAYNEYELYGMMGDYVSQGQKLQELETHIALAVVGTKGVSGAAKTGTALKTGTAAEDLNVASKLVREGEGLAQISKIEKSGVKLMIDATEEGAETLEGMNRPVRLVNPQFPPNQAVMDTINSSKIQKLASECDNYDCSEIAEELFIAAGGQGKILEVRTIPEGNLTYIENGLKSHENLYHQVYTDGRYVYDPRLSPNPIPKGDWEQHIRNINLHKITISDKPRGLR